MGLQTPESIAKRKATLLRRYGTTSTAGFVDKAARRKTIKDKMDAKSFDEVKFRTKRQRLLKECNNTCSMCGNDMWLGQPIQLEIDHINGDGEDHSRENLRVVCPNCHATTPTYKALNMKKRNL